MQVTKEKVVSIHYTLRNNQGDVLDSSVGQSPLLYIQGIGNLIPGMEEGLEGKQKGDKLEIKVSPEKGYGVRSEKNDSESSAFGFWLTRSEGGHAISHRQSPGCNGNTCWIGWRNR
jgi:FKBP-type peptidyl-prolyl cis-trans isomerase SlyD